MRWLEFNATTQELQFTRWNFARTLLLHHLAGGAFPSVTFPVTVKNTMQTQAYRSTVCDTRLSHRFFFKLCRPIEQDYTLRFSRWRYTRLGSQMQSASEPRRRGRTLAPPSLQPLSLTLTHSRPLSLYASSVASLAPHPSSGVQISGHFSAGSSQPNLPRYVIQSCSSLLPGVNGGCSGTSASSVV